MTSSVADGYEKKCRKIRGDVVGSLKEIMMN